MTSKKSAKLGARDRELLEVLRFNPFTAEELLAVSITLTAPFTSVDYLQKRMRLFGHLGTQPHKDDLIRGWPYATTTAGALYYYKLTQRGYRTLFPDTPRPSRAFFQPISLTRQTHTQAIATFLVHTITAAHRAGVQFTDYHPENHHAIQVDGERHASDGRFALVINDVKYAFTLEIDNGTERIRSKQDVDSLQRMARMYEHHLDRCSTRQKERVPIVFGAAFAICSAKS